MSATRAANASRLFGSSRNALSDASLGAIPDHFSPSVVERASASLKTVVSVRGVWRSIVTQPASDKTIPAKSTALNRHGVEAVIAVMHREKGISTADFTRNEMPLGDAIERRNGFQHRPDSCIRITGTVPSG